MENFGTELNSFLQNVILFYPDAPSGVDATFTTDNHR